MKSTILCLLILTFLYLSIMGKLKEDARNIKRRAMRAQTKEKETNNKTVKRRIEIGEQTRQRQRKKRLLDSRVAAVVT